MKRYSLIVLFFLLAVGTLPMAAQVSSTTYTRVYQQSPARANGRQQYSSYRPYGATASASVSHHQPTLLDSRPFAGGTELDNPIGYDMQSTAAMAASGSHYSSNITEPGATSLSSRPPTGRRKGFGGEGEPGEHHDEVHDDPIGSMPLLLMLLLAMGYGFRLYRKSRHPDIS